MNFSREIHKFAVRDAAILTGSYVAGNVIGNVSEYNAIGLEVSFTLGSATSMELKIEESQNGTPYFQQASESASGGTISDSLAIRQFTATGSYAILVTPVRAKYIKVSVKGTGTATGTSATIKAYKSWA